jgi:hypothetical protein
MILSVIALAISAVVSLFGVDLWLAGTQWILISIVLAVYALVLSAHAKCGCGDSCKCGPEQEDEGSREESEQE